MPTGVRFLAGMGRRSRPRLAPWRAARACAQPSSEPRRLGGAGHSAAHRAADFQIATSISCGMGRSLAASWTAPRIRAAIAACSASGGCGVVVPPAGFSPVGASEAA
jgi:polygalacturonase